MVYPSETFDTTPSMLRIGSLAKTSVGMNRECSCKDLGRSDHGASG
jgi:hypothetical protein